ncbi:MAG: HlyC/CorC family transporter, partial [Anaerolineae bacterium]|nr:HlyC/CorC family transporter [Anaerolineae bacterium]
MEILVIILLTIVNGLLSMSEIAVVSARKVRLGQMIAEGKPGARRALELAESPNRFLSTVQIGITLVGILQGAFAGATLAEPLSRIIAQISFLEPLSDALGLLIVVGATTYLSLVIGELVPKRLGLQNPERIASLVAPIMHWLSLITAPVVKLLSVSTELLLRLIGARQSDEPPVTDEEIYSLMEQGTEAGVFDPRETAMVASIMSLDDRRIESLMTPRVEIDWIDLDAPLEETLERIASSKHSRFPIAHESLDQVVGVVRAKDLLYDVLKGQPDPLNHCLREVLFIPESATVSHALELFKQSKKHVALVISEHGGVEGLVTLNNLLDEIVGEIEAPLANRRDDGSWLLDGLLPIDEFKDVLDLKELPDED